MLKGLETQEILYVLRWRKKKQKQHSQKISQLIQTQSLEVAADKENFVSFCPNNFSILARGNKWNLYIISFCKSEEKAFLLWFEFDEQLWIYCFV